jgi:hypothetical protein
MRIEKKFFIYPGGGPAADVVADVGQLPGVTTSCRSVREAQHLPRPVGELRKTGVVKRVEDIAHGSWRVLLFDCDPPDRAGDFRSDLVEQFTQVDVRADDAQPTPQERLGGEVLNIIGDEDPRAASDGCCHVVSIIRVLARHLSDEVLVIDQFDLGVGEKLTDDCGDTGSGGGRALAFSHDDSFPFVEQRVAPDYGVDLVLAQCEQEIHDGEREEHIGVDEDSLHDGWSVGQLGGFDDFGDALSS